MNVFILQFQRNMFFFPKKLNPTQIGASSIVLFSRKQNQIHEIEEEEVNEIKKKK